MWEFVVCDSITIYLAFVVPPAASIANDVRGLLREWQKTTVLLLGSARFRKCFNLFYRIKVDIVGFKQWIRLKSTHQRIITVIVDEFVRPSAEFLLKG